MVVPCLTDTRGFINSKTVFLTDLDGTLLPLLADPETRRIDATAYEYLKKFNDKHPDQVIPITGRDWGQVLQCFGLKEGERPPFPVISSNGAQLDLPSGETFTFDFSEEELNFIDYMKEKMTEFQKEYPFLVTEVKDYEIGFHTSSKAGYEVSDEQEKEASEAAFRLLEGIEVLAEEKGLDFTIEGTEATHREISCRRVNKTFALQQFQKYLTTIPSFDDECWPNVFFMGDSFLSKGNDRPIAKEVNKRGGMTLLVSNHKKDWNYVSEGWYADKSRVPAEADPAEPTFVVCSTSELGGWLASKIEAHMRHLEARAMENADAAPSRPGAKTGLGSRLLSGLRKG